MMFENGSRLLHVEQGFCDGVLEDWLSQGLPATIANPAFWGVTDQEDIFDFFNVAKFAHCSFNQFRIEPLPEQILSESNGRRTYRDGMGNTIEARTDGISLPHVMDYAVKSKGDYLAIREEMIRVDERRWNSIHDENFFASVRNQEDHIVTLHVSGPFGFIRDMVGAETAMMLPYLDEELYRMMLRDHLDVCCRTAEHVIRACRPDCCFIWEDNCYKNGPMVSPNIFREFHLPWYQEWDHFLNVCGVPFSLVDTDGDPTALIPLWVEGGITGILPWEVNAVDMLKISREFPHLVLLGGIYKHVLEKEPSDIEAEIDRVMSVLSHRGGYIASLDHWVYRGIGMKSFTCYCHNLERYGKANRSSRLQKIV